MATTAVAQTPCGLYDEMAERLAEGYREYPTGVGLEANGRLMELFTSSNGETWTLMIVSANGTACVIAVGENWNILQPVVPTDGA